MGDAKRRGPYEVRVEQGKARREREEAEEKAKAEAWWASLTPEQQKAIQERKRKSAETRAMIRMIAGNTVRFPK